MTTDTQEPCRNRNVPVDTMADFAAVTSRELERILAACWDRCRLTRERTAIVRSIRMQTSVPVPFIPTPERGAILEPRARTHARA
jgi:hypothetical protein